MVSSLIIPTLNRTHDLRRCLTSICQLNQQFDEIIIIEQGDIDKTKQLVAIFKQLNINLYFYSIKSAAQARNKGIDKARGKFLFFIDDDTQLFDKNYINTALDYFKKHPKVVALTGKILIDKKNYQQNIWARFYHRLFLLNGANINIRRSGTHNDGWFSDKIQNAQWLFGGHMVCRDLVFKQGFRFNKNFIRRSDYEDAIFGYQLYKFYGEGALVYLPTFKLKHFDANEMVSTYADAIKMQVVYQFIFWQQTVSRHSLFDLICYCYAQIGIVLIEIFHPERGKNRWLKFKVFVKSYIYILKNHQKIANNSIDYNRFITHG